MPVFYRQNIKFLLAVNTGVRFIFAANAFNAAGIPLLADNVGLLGNNILATPITFLVELPGIGVKASAVGLANMAFLTPVVPGTIGDMAFEFVIDQFGNVTIF